MFNPSNVTTNEVRFSYVHLFKPYASMPNQEEKYSVTVLVPKNDTDTMNRINAAIEAAKARGTSDRWNGIVPPVVQTPVYDGDGVRPSDGMPFGEECKGHYVFTASTSVDYPPEVVDINGNPILNASAVYSGCYGRVNVTFFPYAFGAKKGIGCSLGPVQKTKDGDMLGGSMPKAADVFGKPKGTVMQQPVQQSYVNPITGQPMQTTQPIKQSYINPITGQATSVDPNTGFMQIPDGIDDSGLPFN